MEHKVNEIVLLLKLKTQSNQAEWQMADQESFFIDFIGSRIVINKYDNPFVEHNQPCTMFIYNNRNEVIYSLTEDDNPFVSELFSLAKDNYYNTNETFDKLLNQLRDPDLTIGDLPF